MDSTFSIALILVMFCSFVGGIAVALGSVALFVDKE